MGYSEKDVLRLSELLKEIQGRKAHDRDATTYRDVPAMLEIEQTVERQLSANGNGACDADAETLRDSIAVLRFLADAYDSMGRSARSAKLYGHILTLAALLKTKYDEDTEAVLDIFYTALRARNVYRDDDCADLERLAVCLLPRDDVERMISERRAHRRTLRHDPVEATEEYLAVIDLVEARIEKNRKTYGHGSCYEIWSLKTAYLAEYGIEWRSPAQMNPKFRFD